jgi:hypothetical protein
MSDIDFYDSIHIAWLDKIAPFIDGLQLIVIVAIEFAILKPVKFKMDRAALITMGLYLGVALIRFANDLLPRDFYVPEVAIFFVTQAVTWMILFHFVMEMQII